MSVELKKFVNSLEDNRIFEFNINHFDSRLRLQKYVYISSFFDRGLDYDYGLYIHGPYSNSLAKHYYTLDSVNTRRNKLLDDDFINLIRNRSSRWLEIASTILLFKRRNPRATIDELVKSVQNVKHKAPKHFISSIANTLSDLDLV